MVITAALAALNLGEVLPRVGHGHRGRDAGLQVHAGIPEADRGQRIMGPRVERGGDGPRQAPGPRSLDGSRREVPTPSASINFDRVAFHYPGDSRMIFEELDFSIPVGKCTALVGVNGAGKTTLVKLLARLYEPTAGAVRVDGVDISDYPVTDWRARLAVIFQDFARYEFSAADNVALRRRRHLDDRAGVRSVIQAAGLAEALDALPHGIDTVLARHVAGGTDLSGGQWQRVAIGRALFALRHGASIVVLDEPTASLDVRAEARFFEEFTQLARGATTLLISHRFSTVRQADLVVVLEDGRVVEQGSHEALMAQGGRYAHLFSLQADRFADDEAAAGGEDETVEMPL